MSDTFQFPEPLSERYRPRKVSEFIGLEKPRKVISAFLTRPCSSAWLFIGPPGVVTAKRYETRARSSARTTARAERGI